MCLHWQGTCLTLLSEHFGTPELLSELWFSSRVRWNENIPCCYFPLGLGDAGRVQQTESYNWYSGGASWVPGKGLMHCAHRVPLLLTTPQGGVPSHPRFMGEAVEAQTL